ncbi:hypothetical protein TNIN_109301 [Trichonephila inaurata madagascariensis]|uniref:Uncharacterized protein n=1 Tax=Trichonephila inaurata madagascariensis TaxID=2747483 RepID=A0A8X6WVP2_9ARAC|nr:hypothetical protein TNIN_109301 [Trichonephila inaurata madagascariensis]
MKDAVEEECKKIKIRTFFPLAVVAWRREDIPPEWCRDSYEWGKERKLTEILSKHCVFKDKKNMDRSARTSRNRGRMEVVGSIDFFTLCSSFDVRYTKYLGWRPQKVFDNFWKNLKYTVKLFDHKT